MSTFGQHKYNQNVFLPLQTMILPAWMPLLSDQPICVKMIAVQVLLIGSMFAWNVCTHTDDQFVSFREFLCRLFESNTNNIKNCVAFIPDLPSKISVLENFWEVAVEYYVKFRMWKRIIQNSTHRSYIINYVEIPQFTLSLPEILWCWSVLYFVIESKVIWIIRYISEICFGSFRCMHI